MLAIASILDLKSREIPDKIWAIFGGFGALILILELNDGSTPFSQTPLTPFATYYGLGIAVMSVIGFAAYKTGLFGGADPKALVAIAVILPGLDATWKIHDFTALMVLSNALILSMAGIVHNVLRNTHSLVQGVSIFNGIEEGRMKKLLAFAVGYYSNSSGKFLFGMEERDDRGRRRFKFNPSSYDEFEMDTKERWVTQALPFILYIGMGFVVTLVVGDLIALLLSVAL